LEAVDEQEVHRADTARAHLVGGVARLGPARKRITTLDDIGRAQSIASATTESHHIHCENSEYHSPPPPGTRITALKHAHADGAG